MNGLNNRNVFPQSSGLKSKVKVPSIWCLVRPLIVAYRQPPSCCILTCPFFCVCVERDLQFPPASYKEANPKRLKPHPYDLIYPLLPFQVPFPSTVVFVVRAPTQEFGKKHNSVPGNSVLHTVNYKLNSDDLFLFGFSYYGSVSLRKRLISITA